ncbi:MAG: hypothetical protein WAQ28_03420 [Bacteroidia bacterium]
METGEKNFEYRKPTDWILSRLFDKNGHRRLYDYVRISHGYSANRPYFIATLEGWYIETITHTKCYSTGFQVVVEPKDICIMIGTIVKRGTQVKPNKPIRYSQEVKDFVDARYPEFVEAAILFGKHCVELYKKNQLKEWE